MSEQNEGGFLVESEGDRLMGFLTQDWKSTAQLERESGLSPYVVGRILTAASRDPDVGVEKMVRSEVRFYRKAATDE